ncbi:MAG: hypothetical protein HY000_35595 [Planctomycetes bacterium]|nr:hypothetical protein [Planctomycetota bacterium]
MTLLKRELALHGKTRLEEGPHQCLKHAVRSCRWAREFVVKPFDPAVLERKLEQVLAGTPTLN